MASKSKLSIRAAVMNCLARCSDSDAPLCCLGEFLEKLAAMGWCDEDVKSVQKSVLRLLGKTPPGNLSDTASASLAGR